LGQLVSETCCSICSISLTKNSSDPMIKSFMGGTWPGQSRLGEVVGVGVGQQRSRGQRDFQDGLGTMGIGRCVGFPAWRWEDASQGIC
jgi:hypothetical protein